jgi:hypothetical protein
MRIHRKVITAYDLRQQEYKITMESRADTKVMQRKQSGGYRRPGSRNPRKARG